jgi:hypothetical protein
MAIQDLKTVCGSREERPDLARPAVVAVDEFSGLAGDQIAGLFQRARSAGLSLVMATQELADLRRVARASTNRLSATSSGCPPDGRTPQLGRGGGRHCRHRGSVGAHLPDGGGPRTAEVELVRESGVGTSTAGASSTARIHTALLFPHAPGKDLVGAQLLSRRMGAGSAVGPRHPTSRDAPLLRDPPPRRPDRRRRPGRNRRSHRADDDRPLHACTAALVRSGATGDRTRSMNTVVAFWSHGGEEPSSQAKEHRPTEPKVRGSNPYGRARSQSAIPRGERDRGRSRSHANFPSDPVASRQS